jgi:hypothetical protein
LLSCSMRLVHSSEQMVPFPPSVPSLSHMNIIHFTMKPKTLFCLSAKKEFKAQGIPYEISPNIIIVAFPSYPESHLTD